MEKLLSVSLSSHDWNLVLLALAAKEGMATTEGEELAFGTVRSDVFDQFWAASEEAEEKAFAEAEAGALTSPEWDPSAAWDDQTAYAEYLARVTHGMDSSDDPAR